MTNLADIMSYISIGLVLILFIWAGFMAYDIYMQKNHCQKYELKYFREEGVRYGTVQVETTKEHADYSEEVCVKW